jgi:eukaryotic-like serine/threonine-protein kinase
VLRSSVVQGRVLANRYRLISQLGQGGMGAVWRAQHVELGTPAAVKLIDETIAMSPEATARFKREAQAAASLRSPYVVQILDYGVDEGTPYIAMELLEGESLADRLKRVGRLAPDVTAAIFLQVARAVGKAHEMGIVHRDLKPDNVFLVRADDEEIAKVLDFGIAKQTQVTADAGAPATRTGAILGTPHYMSPEQASGRKAVDYRTDVWALSVIAFECLTGRRPFVDDTLGGLLLSICTDPPPVPSTIAQVPPGFDQWFARGVDKNPDGRFTSVREAAAELSRLCGRVSQIGIEPTSLQAGSQPRWDAPVDVQTGPTLHQSPSVVTVPGASRKSSWPILAVLAGVLVAGGLGVVVLLVVVSRPATPQPAAAASVELPAGSVSVPLPELVAAPVVVPVVAPAPSASASVAPPTRVQASPRPAAAAAPAPPVATPKPQPKPGGGLDSELGI